MAPAPRLMRSENRFDVTSIHRNMTHFLFNIVAPISRTSIFTTAEREPLERERERERKRTDCLA